MTKKNYWPMLANKLGSMLAKRIVLAAIKKIMVDVGKKLPTNSFIIKMDQFWSIKYWLEGNF